MDRGVQTRVVLTGPESTGKSTLCRALSDYNTITVVYEYAREYLSALNRPYTFEDLNRIAEGQYEAMIEDKESSFLICDTGFVVLNVWSQEVFGRVPESIVNYLHEVPVDLYLLCSPDFPWVIDPLRENPRDRDRLFAIYISLLSSLKVPYHILTGNEAERLSQALVHIDNLL